MEAFQNEKGEFDRAHFTQILRAHGLSEEAFLVELRRELIRDQLIRAVTVGVHVPEEMVDPLFDSEYQHRRAAVLIVSPKSIPAPSQPSDSVLEAFYKENKKAFKTPELRSLTAIILRPEALAHEISVSDEEIRNMYESQYEALGKKPLKDVRDAVVSAVRKEKASEKIHELAQKLEDEIAGGATFEEIAKNTPAAELVQLKGIDSRGKDRQGTVVAQLPKDKELAKEMLQLGFELEEAMDSPFSQAQSGEYFTIQVDKVTPASFEDFAEVKARVLKEWTELERLNAAQKKAEKHAKAFNDGDRRTSLMTVLPSLSLSEPSPTVSDEVKSLVFSLRPGQAAVTPVKEGFAVVVLNKIIPPQQMDKNDKIKSFEEGLSAQYKNDVLSSYIKALRIRFPVSFNQELLQAMYTRARE
jgi:peptidyl-prolyl cis-trans isomerase D